jgi:hypothetical protein
MTTISLSHRCQSRNLATRTLSVSLRPPPRPHLRSLLLLLLRRLLSRTPPLFSLSPPPWRGLLLVPVLRRFRSVVAHLLVLVVVPVVDVRFLRRLVPLLQPLPPVLLRLHRVVLQLPLVVAANCQHVLVFLVLLVLLLVLRHQA